MGINLNPFTWWNGATIGTWFGLRGKAQVGEDSLGNVYYEGGRDTAGRPRRWVIYSGSNDASRVPPEWFSWLHHQIDTVPGDALPAPRRWQASRASRAQAGDEHSKLRGADQRAVERTSAREEATAVCGQSRAQVRTAPAVSAAQRGCAAYLKLTPDNA